MQVTITKKKVEISFNYSPTLVTTVKTTFEQFGRKYDPDSKSWWFPTSSISSIEKLGIFTRFIEEYGFEVYGTEFIDKIKEKLQNKLIDINKLSKIAESVVEKPTLSGRCLFQHQKDGVRILVKKSLILADQMGTGKSATLAATAKVWKEYDNSIKIVVCAPISLHKNLVREFKDLDVEIEIYSAAKIPEEIEGKYILIGDESHFYSSIKAQRTRKFLNLAKSAIAVYPATGTPMASGRPKNLFPLLLAIGHPLSENKFYYDKHFCDLKETRFTKYDNSGAINLDELHKLTKNSILRRTKDECLDLPEKLRVLREIDLDEEGKRIYKNTLSSLKADYFRRLREGEIKSGGEALVFLGHIRKASSLAKMAYAIQLIEEILDEGKSVVLFSHYSEVVEKIAKHFKGLYINGDTQKDDRQILVDQFQDGKNKVFCLTMAGGVGITLTKSDIIIMLDREFNPGDNFQVEDRCHRIGQKNAVTAIWLQYGQADELIDDIILEKQQRIELLLEGKRKTLRGLSTMDDAAKEILKEIFE